MSTPTPAPAGRRDAAVRTAASGELPLFRGGSRDDDAPLVKLPAVPRVPVSVRKSTVVPRPPQPRPVFEEFELDLEPEDDFDPEVDVEEDADDETYSDGDGTSADYVAPTPRRPAAAAVPGAVDVAPIIPRLLAAIVDLGLLLGMDALGLWEKKRVEVEEDVAIWRAIGEATDFESAEVKPIHQA